jgi:hypothetical protein
MMLTTYKVSGGRPCPDCAVDVWQLNKNLLELIIAVAARLKIDFPSVYKIDWWK